MGERGPCGVQGLRLVPFASCVEAPLQVAWFKPCEPYHPQVINGKQVQTGGGHLSNVPRW